MDSGFVQPENLEPISRLDRAKLDPSEREYVDHLVEWLGKIRHERYERRRRGSGSARSTGAEEAKKMSSPVPQRPSPRPGPAHPT
jgi:hypothetical protein